MKPAEEHFLQQHQDSSMEAFEKASANLGLLLERGWENEPGENTDLSKQGKMLNKDCWGLLGNRSNNINKNNQRERYILVVLFQSPWRER